MPAFAAFGAAGIVEAADVSVPDQPAQTLQEVVVTGSRIPTTDTSDRATPLTVLDQDELTHGGNDSLGNALQQLPSNTGSPLNTNRNNGGDGSVRVDLRGIGPQRTLVLLNGRRLPAGGVGGDFSVDVNTLPLSMVERVEVMTSGASAVYGADAVAGVVNVITRSAFRGAQFGVTQSETEYGDGIVTRAQALIGRDVAGGNWMLGGEYIDQRAVRASARDYSSVPLSIDANGALVFTGSPSTPDGRFGVPDGNVLGLPAGFYTHVPGATGQGAGAYRPYTSQDAFNYAPYSYLQTPNERGSVWLLGTEPFEHYTLFTEGLFDVRDSSQQFAPSPYANGTGRTPTLTDGELGIPSNNYYNPFGVDITNVRRRLVELGERTYSERITLWRALVGVRGELRGWNWSVSAADAQSHATTSETNVPSGERLIAALGPSGLDAHGGIVCGSPDPATGIVAPASIISGCVPLNLFGGAGTITPVQLAYINLPLRDHGTNDQRFVEADANGTLGHLWGTPVRWALGGQWRRESGSYQLDPLRRGGAAGEGLQSDVPAGSQDTREIYAETRLALTAPSRPDGAELVAGARWSDFSSYGTQASWHAGIHWQLLTPIALRADYSEVFRTPSLPERYTTQVSGTARITDPCGNQPPDPAVQANCRAQGVPGGSYEQAGDIDVRSGGNPDLGPEHGSSLDVGLDLRTPQSTFTASVDFYRLDFRGFILANDPQASLDACATEGAAWACSRIHRLADGSVDYVDARNANFGRGLIQGLDLGAAAGLRPRLGIININVLASYLQTHDVTLPDGTVLHGAGTLADGALPRWRALARSTWELGTLRAGYAVQLIGTYQECFSPLGAGDSSVCRAVGSVIYHDVDLRWQPRPLCSVTVGVNNLTNVQPPFVNNSLEDNTDPSTYRLLGRTYFAQLAFGFQ